MTRALTGVVVELLDPVRLAKQCKLHGILEPAYSTNGIVRQYKYGKPVAAVILSTEGVASTNVMPGMICIDTEAFDWQYLALEAAEFCLTGETIDLARHIRVFGSRLDGNVYAWKQWAGVTPKVEAL